MSIVIPPIAGDPGSPVASVPAGRRIGSLWRRVVAFLLDGIVVGTVATVIALPFFDPLSRLGAWGRLLGFCLAVPYYGLLNSRIGNGQTLGKRWLRLQVVDAKSETLPFFKSLVRYVVLSAPFFLNDITLPVTRTPKSVLYLLSIIVFGLGAITIYLVLFNRKTRQGIHDLAVGSYVAEAENLGALHVEPIWKGHWAVLATLAVLGILGAKIFESKMLRMWDFPAMMNDVRMVEHMADVQSAGVRDLTWTSWSSKEKKRIYVVSVFWSGKKTDEQALANQVASQILRNNSQVMNRDILRIVVIRGYDLGIAHAQVTDTFEETPANWEAKLAGVPTKEVPAPNKL